MIPEAAVEAAAETLKRRLAGVVDDDDQWDWEHDARAALEAAAPHIQAQTLDEAVDAFPLETIIAPDNAVVWMHRRAQEIRDKAQ